MAALSDPSLYKMDKLWISLPVDGEALDDDEQAEILNPEAEIEVRALSSLGLSQQHPGSVD